MSKRSSFTRSRGMGPKQARSTALRTALNTSLVAGTFVALGTLPGCALAPAPDHAQVLTDALPEVTIPEVWGAAAEAGTVPDGWLRSFENAQLEALVGEALKHNLDLRAADARLRQAAATAERAGAALQPSLDATATGGAQGSGDQRVSQRGAGLQATWELDLWGRVRSQAAAATAFYQGAALDREFARQSLAAATAKAFFLASETAEQVTLAKDDLAASEEMLRVIELRRTAGKADAQDVHLAQSQIHAAKERQSAATAASDQAIRALEALVGRYPANALQIDGVLPVMPGPVPAGLPSEVLERRPDVAAAEVRVEGAFRAVQERKLARLPRVALTASAGVSSDLTGLTRRGDGFFNVGANFFAPLLDGGQRQAEVEIASAEQEQALVAYGQTALRAFLEVENALGGETALTEREASLQTAVTEGTEALRLRRLEVDAGKADTLGALQLQRQVYAAQSALRSLRTARLAQRVDLHLALGGDFDVPPPAAAPTTP